MELMRPVKLAGDQLIWGENTLSHLATLEGKKAVIVLGGSSMEKAGFVKMVKDYLKQAGIESVEFGGVEPDPHLATVKRGAAFMLEERPDWIIALGGGSTMDAAKAMWVFYEHPEIKELAEVMRPYKVPTLRGKARFCCIPSTSGSASEVSRSIVISDDETGQKIGIGDMEMMPDVAICDPLVCTTMPPHITAETGMDALTHCIEALTSTRAHFLSDLMAGFAAQEIFNYLPMAYSQGDNLVYREKMLNASMVAGMAFTNVSLGIVHSIAQSLGGYYVLSHGLGDAVVLPYVIEFNSTEPRAKQVYEDLAAKLGVADLAQAVRALNRRLNIPDTLEGVLDTTPEQYLGQLTQMAETALNDGCTKTNPIIPTIPQLEELLRQVYFGKQD